LQSLGCDGCKGGGAEEEGEEEEEMPQWCIHGSVWCEARWRAGESGAFIWPQSTACKPQLKNLWLSSVIRDGWG
jgi:hypothetical protein